MKKLFLVGFLVVISMVMPQMTTPVSAHTPVNLLNTDTTPNAGPLLVDATISFAIRAAFTKSGQTKAFRAALKEGDELVVEYLILDKKPENALQNTKLPILEITSPSGKRVTVKLNERTKFYYPGLNTNFIYLSRYRASAESGTYNFVVKSRTRSAIVIGVGEKEIPGKIRR